MHYIPINLKHLLFLLLFLGTTQVFSQNARALLMEPVFKVVLNHEERWSYSFGMAHRSLLLETYKRGSTSAYNTEHIELNHYTQYDINSSAAVSLRLRYRFKELFNEELYDESRIIQEFFYSRPDAIFNLWHRARFEQRFHNIRTDFRLRYRIGISHLVGSDFSVGGSTETLYSFSARAKPEPEQRFTISIRNSSVKDLDLSLGFEYRLSDYLDDPIREYFLITGGTLYF